MSRNKKLYLDDCRIPLEEGFDVVTSYDEFVNYIESNGLPELISLDHDLGFEHIRQYFMNQEQGITQIDYSQFTEKTGLDCAKWLCDYCMEKDLPLCKVVVHSHNEVGLENIRSYINSFRRVTGQEQNCVQVKINFKLKEQDGNVKLILP